MRLLLNSWDSTLDNSVTNVLLGGKKSLFQGHPRVLWLKTEDKYWGLFIFAVSISLTDGFLEQTRQEESGSNCLESDCALPLGQLSVLSSWYCGSYLPFGSYPLFTVKLISSCWCHPGGTYGSFHYLWFYEGIYNMYLNIVENIELVPCIASKKDFLS